MNIPFFPYSKLYESHKKDFIDIFDDVCSRGAFILQKDLEEIEKNISEFVGAKHVFGVANGTDALIIGLRSCGIGEGDEVIVPSHTYIASPASIHFVGAKPILTELGADGMMDSEIAGRYRRFILAPGGSIDAAEMVENFLGRPYDFDSFEQWLNAD